MGNLGCQVTRNFFKCRECKTPSSGFYDPSLGITICENYATNKSVIEHTILHETIHSYDYCRADIDTKNCVQVACSEIRAVNLSGECKFTRELGRMNFGWINHHQVCLHKLLTRLVNRIKECVKRRVEATMKLQPLCKDKSTNYIEVAWKSCYRDWEPFKHVQ